MAKKLDRISPDDPLGVSPLDLDNIRNSVKQVARDVTRPVLREKQQLTLPLISMAHKEVLACQCLAEPYPADFELGPDANKPPIVVRILDLDTMTQALLICNTLVMSAFERAGGLLAGRYFRLIAGEMKKGKTFNYREIQISEMELDTNE